MRVGRGAWTSARQNQWDDWQWQQQNRLRTAADLERFLPLTDDERLACDEATQQFRMAVTPYYLSLVDGDRPDDPVRAQAIPTTAELRVLASEHLDPGAEEAHMPVVGVTHRYPDRVLFYVTHNCPVYCRHCFRKRKVSDPATAAPREQLAAGIHYIRNTPAVRDVILSGGDPLTFSDARLADLLGQLAAIEHVDMIRIHTRNLVTLPQRVTPALAQIFAAHPPIYVNTQFNHLQECTDEAAEALARLADAGCVLGNQMVLLAGINEDPQMVREMNRWLLRHRCRPYYIHQCDAAQGISHFRTPVATGLRIIDELRGWTSGLAVPHYVVDLPRGGGKVPLVPNYLREHTGKHMVFRNFAGDEYPYEEG